MVGSPARSTRRSGPRVPTKPSGDFCPHQLPGRLHIASAHRQLQPRRSASGRFSRFGNDIIFDPPENLQERVSIELESGDVFFDRPRDTVDRYEECQLSVAESIEQFLIAGRNSEDRVAIGHQFHFG